MTNVTKLDDWVDASSITISSGSNRLLVVCAAMEASSDYPISATYGGQSLTNIYFDYYNSDSLSVWTLDESGISAASGTSISFTTNLGGPVDHIFAASFENVDQTSPIADSQSGENHGSPSDTITCSASLTVGAEEFSFQAASNKLYSTDTSHTSGYTTQQFNGGSSVTLGVADRAAGSSATPTNFQQWSGNTSISAIFAASLAAASSGTETVASISGSATASGVGESTAESVGSISGSATVSGVGSSQASGVGSFSGSATVSGVGESTAETVGSTSGSATVSGVGKSTSEAVGGISGVATVSMVGASQAAAVFSASGSSTVIAVPKEIAAKAVRSAGGWWFAYEQEMFRRDEEEELKRKARILKGKVSKAEKKTKNQERIKELKRLTKLVEQFQEEIKEETNDRVIAAASRAVKNGNYSAMAALDRELKRMKEEEQFLEQAARILLAQ
jgi:hypothetical protein